MKLLKETKYIKKKKKNRLYILHVLFICLTLELPWTCYSLLLSSQLKLQSVKITET